jgi:hypothetical protein
MTEEPKPWWHCAPPPIEEADGDDWSCDCGQRWTLRRRGRVWVPVELAATYEEQDRALEAEGRRA